MLPLLRQQGWADLRVRPFLFAPDFSWYQRFTGRERLPMFRADSTAPSNRKPITAMRAETEKLVDEIKQAISLLRRHL
jgi:hypothetical protein